MLLVQVLLLTQFIGEIRDKFCNTDKRQTTKKNKGRLHDLEEEKEVFSYAKLHHRDGTQRNAKVRNRGDPGAVCGHYLVITFSGRIGNNGV